MRDLEDLNEVQQREILEYLNRKYPINDAEVPFKPIEGTNYKFVHMNTEYYDKGIIRFQGIIFMKKNNFIIKTENIVHIPMFLFPFIDTYRIIRYYPEINSLCYTIWFNKPLSDEIISSFPKNYK